MGRSAGDDLQQNELEVCIIFCHTEVNRHEKDEFRRILVRKRHEAGGLEHNWHTVKSFLQKEMKTA